TRRWARAVGPRSAEPRSDEPRPTGTDLVVVESPSKARTLERMLGAGYTVEASFGHIRDLPKSKLGIDLKTFTPDYVVPDDSEKVARQLRTHARKADHVWLATDLHP